MDPPRDDAQRSLEQHALRNVRSLYEKLARADQMDAHGERFVMRTMAIVVILVASGVAASMLFKPDERAAQERRRCEIDASSDVVYEWRREARARDPSVTSEYLEKTISVTHDNVKAEAARRCAGNKPAK